MPEHTLIQGECTTARYPVNKNKAYLILNINTNLKIFRVYEENLPLPYIHNTHALQFKGYNKYEYANL